MDSTVKVCENPSSSLVSTEQWSLGNNSANGEILAGFVIVYFVAGFPLNAITAVAIVTKKLYSQPTVMLLLGLIVSDILLLLFSVPLYAVTGIRGEYILGSTDEQRCKTCILGVISPILFLNSLFIVMLMSIERFVYIYQPFLHERNATKFSTIISIVGAFIFSIITCIPYLAVGMLIEFSPVHFTCVIAYAEVDWPLIVIMCVIAIVLVVIIVSNICTACIVRKNIREVYGSSVCQRKSETDKDSEYMRKKRQEKQLHMFHVFSSLVLSNLITWLPILVLVFLDVANRETYVPMWVTTFANVLFFSQVVIHPIIETILIRDVREAVKNMITCGLWKKCSTDKLDSCFKCQGKECQSSRSFWTLINEALILRDSANSCRTATKSTRSGDEVAA